MTEASSSPSPSPKTALRYACVALAATMWGTWPVILRTAESIGPLPAEIESAVAMGVLTLVSAALMAKDKIPQRANMRAWMGIVWLGIADAANVALFFRAYRTTSVAIAVLTHYLTPILVALLAPIFLKERASLRTFVAVLFSFGGLLLLLSPWEAARKDGDVIGALMGAGSALCYASNVLVTKRLSGSFSPSEMMFFHGLVAMPLLFFLVPREAWGTLDMRALGVLTLAALGPSALAGLIFVWALRGLPASHVSTLTLLEPLVAVMFGAALYGERLPLLGALGGALILGGAVIVVWRRTG